MSDITRSEAVDVIESIMRKYEEDECICCDITLGDEDYEALRLARDSLKADEAYQLEYEGTTKNDLSSGLEKNSKKLENGTTKNDLGVDCVSRQAVLDLINADWKYENLEIEINNLTSVTPQEPRKGHWISHREHCKMNNLLPSGLGSYFWCSECDCGIDSKNFSRVNYNYCPNCGADMREVEK